MSLRLPMMWTYLGSADKCSLRWITCEGKARNLGATSPGGVRSAKAHSPSAASQLRLLGKCSSAFLVWSSALYQVGACSCGRARIELGPANASEHAIAEVQPLRDVVGAFGQRVGVVHADRTKDRVPYEAGAD